ncbi:hypothetical protein [Paraburkholderia sp. C35]|uniref:hypothetical protein n=1 Tax=Paraburkholderia sp. C35 TaxID=2126993 RepID=UPI000D6A04BC|nr:hypothetical protein [Paraburkholderia sp. C35]
MKSVPDKPWSGKDLGLLWEAWASEKSYKELMHLFPGRTWEAVRSAALYKFGRRPCGPSRAESVSIVLIRRLLEKKGPLTADEIAGETRIACRTVMEVLRFNCGSKFHVVDYKPSGRAKSKVWAVGGGESAPRPPRLTPIQISRRYHQRQREMKLQQGELVKSINPFSTALGLSRVPEGKRGRVFQTSMNLKDFDDEREAA